MATLSTTLQTKYGFFHLNSKTLTEENQYVFESRYNASHVMFTKDILIDSLSYCATTTDADNFVTAHPLIVRKYTLFSLTQVANSNGQSWYINDDSNGGWQKPIIVGSLAPQDGTNAPSDGFDPKLYKSDNSLITPTTGIWWIDPYQGILKCSAGYTPSDLSWGTPKITCYVYTGRKLTDFVADDTTRECVYSNTVLSVPTSTQYTIDHNLNSYNLETTVYGYDSVQGGWIEQLAPILFTTVNRAILSLTEAMDVRVIFRKVG